MDCDFSPSSPHLLPNGLFSPQNQISFELLALSGLSGFSTFKGGKMLIFQGFANSRIVREFPPFSFKVRIATLTRNQLNRKVPWVRIPPAPPEITPVVGFFRLLAFLFQFCAKPKPLSIASGIQMCVNVRRSPEVAVTKPFLNLLHRHTVCRGNIEFKHYQTLERFLEAARHSYAGDRDT